MFRVAITTLGCKINQFESAAMTETLLKEGYRLVPFSEEADIYIVNSCTVTAKTDAESRRLIRRGIRLNPQARIVVTGCYAQMAGEELLKIPGVNLILGNSEKRDIGDFLKELDDRPKAVVSDIAQEKNADGCKLESFAEHTRAFLQVQNGCDARCAYCIVPFARGKSRSVPLKETLAAVTSFSAQGFKEIVLTGIHLGAYGLDLAPRTDLLELMRQIEVLDAVPRLRVGSVEPTEISPEFIAHLAASRIVCPHLHIPLQSGSDTVLSRMNRGYDTTLFGDLMTALTDAVPGICLGADVIAGFPAETEEEFLKSCGFLESLPLSYLHVFPFSPRPGTPAAEMTPQVPPNVIRERAAALRRISEKKMHGYLNGFVGRQLMVLVQKDEGKCRGLSRNYLPVVITEGKAACNTEVRVEITAVRGKDLIGRVIS